MAVREWHVDAGSTHVIRVEHGFWSGRAVIWLDGVEIYRRGFTFNDFGFVHRFEIEGVEYSLRATCHALCHYRYELVESWRDESTKRSGWTIAVTRALLTPAIRLAWSAGCIVVVAIFVFVDAAGLWHGRASSLAPTEFDLWLSIVLGTGYGLIVLIWERHLFLRRRAELLELCRTPIEQRCAWKFQRVNLRNGWPNLLFLALIVWCGLNGIFPGPLVFAAGAVAAAGNLKIAAEFKADLERMDVVWAEGAGVQ